MMRSLQAVKVASPCAAFLIMLSVVAHCAAQQPIVQPYPVTPSYQSAPARLGSALFAPQPASYNPVGFGFGGYSYGGYPAYGFNGYLPSVYAGFNTPGVAGPAPGGYSFYNASEAYGATCGPTGCRLNYRGWSPEAAISRPVAPQPAGNYSYGSARPR